MGAKLCTVNFLYCSSSPILCGSERRDSSHQDAGVLHARNTDEPRPHKRSSVPPGDKLLIHAKLLKGFGHAAQTLVTHEAAVLSHAIHLLHRAVPDARQICLDFILRTFSKFVFVGF